MYHFDLNYDVARMRHNELVERATRGRASADTPRRRRWFRRLRPAEGAALAPAQDVRRLVVVPPPRHDRDPSGRDTRVA